MNRSRWVTGILINNFISLDMKKIESIVAYVCAYLSSELVSDKEAVFDFDGADHIIWNAHHHHFLLLLLLLK